MNRVLQFISVILRILIEMCGLQVTAARIAQLLNTQNNHFDPRPMIQVQSLFIVDSDYETVMRLISHDEEDQRMRVLFVEVRYWMIMVVDVMMRLASCLC